MINSDVQEATFDPSLRPDRMATYSASATHKEANFVGRTDKLHKLSITRADPAETGRASFDLAW